MKLAFIFISLTLSLGLFAQQTKHDSIKALQEIVRHENSISMPGLSYAGVPSRQWYSSAFLISLATTEELVQMTKDTSESLKLCAFIGLVYNNYPDLSKIRKSLSSDTTTLLSLEGCVIDWTTVGYAVNHIDQWNAVNPMKQLIQRLRADKTYRDELYEAIINKNKINPYN